MAENQESKRPRLTFDSSPELHTAIMKYCKAHKITLRDFSMEALRRELARRNFPEGTLSFIKRPEDEKLVLVVYTKDKNLALQLKGTEITVKLPQETTCSLYIIYDEDL